MARDMKRSASLSRDQRGVIFVPALVMGALLTGALFYVAAVGDAIVFRTELQNAADVTSFESAVWHARGMNVIAILNILMSLGLAVFAAIRIAEVVLFLLSLIPILTPFVSEPLASLVEAEETVAPIINTALRVVKGAQDGVSAAVPYVAFADAKMTPTSASTIWPLSMALVPPQVDRVITPEHRREPHYLPAALPVENGEFGTLCAKAVTFIPKQIASLLERAHFPLAGRFSSLADTILDDIGGKVFGAGDGIFCQPLEGGISKIIDLIGSAADSACDQVRQYDDEEENGAERREEADNGDEHNSDRRHGRRADGSRRKPIDCGDAADSVEGAGLSFEVKPAMVWTPASNGSVFMHTWSWATGEPRLFPSAQRGIGVADHGRLPSVTPSTTAVAMSEYYFDCTEEWDEKCEPDALWAPNWTARVRRFRSPGEEFLRIGLDSGTEFLDTLQQSVGDHASEAIGEVIHNVTGVPSDNPVARWLGEQIDRIPIVQEISQKIDSVVGGLRESTGIDELLDPRRYTNPDRIH